MIPWNEIWNHCRKVEEEEDFRDTHEAHLSLASDIIQIADVVENKEALTILDSDEYDIPLREEVVEKICAILAEERDRLIQEYNSLWE